MVGGSNGTGKEAGLLTSRPRQAARDQGNPWNCQTLAPMNESRRHCPDMLLFGRDRLLVAAGGSRFADVLHVTRYETDRDVWTLITQPLTQAYQTTFLVNFNNRILAIGKLPIRQAISNKKSWPVNMYCSPYRMLERM